MYNRLNDESDEELIYRICSEKDIIGTWKDVANILNELLQTEYTESKFRKQFQAFQKMMNANKNKFTNNNERESELLELKRDFEKEKIKFRDERNAYQKLIREQARKESFIDLVKDIISSEVKPFNNIQEKIYKEEDFSSNDLIMHITDIHTGIEINNWKNTFNQDILSKRMYQYMSESIRIKYLHNSENLYIVIGEILSGLIHNNLRLQNNMDLIEQFKYISELISEMICTISEHFKEINIYITPGNHSRITQKKEDSLDGENMDILLPFYLKAKLQNYDNINIFENKVERSIAVFNIRGNTIMASHGDKDSPQNVVQNLTMMFGIKPSIVLLGHRHTNSLTTVYDTKIIQSGCVSGTDEYSLSIRKTNKPEQTISVVNDNGLVCLYDIQLD